MLKSSIDCEKDGISHEHMQMHFLDVWCIGTLKVEYAYLESLIWNGSLFSLPMQLVHVGFIFLQF